MAGSPSPMIGWLPPEGVEHSDSIMATALAQISDQTAQQPSCWALQRIMAIQEDVPF